MPVPRAARYGVALDDGVLADDVPLPDGVPDDDVLLPDGVPDDDVLLPDGVWELLLAAVVGKGVPLPGPPDPV
jgi:hypothetical protein